MEVILFKADKTDCYKVSDISDIIIKGADTFEIHKSGDVVELKLIKDE